MRIPLILTSLLAASLLAAAPLSRRPDPPEQTIQLKLRDLLDAIPRKTAEQILAKLTAIEGRLAAIEKRLPPAGVPAPEPLGSQR